MRALSRQPDLIGLTFRVDVKRNSGSTAHPVLAVGLAQVIVDVGRSDCRVAECDGDLIDLVDDVSSGVKARDGGSLMRVDDMTRAPARRTSTECHG